MTHSMKWALCLRWAHFGPIYHHPGILTFIPAAMTDSCNMMLSSSMCRKFTRWTRANNISHINRNFNPQSHQQQRKIRIQRPAYDPHDYLISKSIERQEAKSKVAISKAEQDRIFKYYSEEVLTIESYIDAAFRSTRTNEVYLFLQEEYLVLNYTPGTTNARVVDGPHYIPNGFHSLFGTKFGNYGIDAAFGCHGGHDESFIFYGDTCAKINYAPWATNDKILEGPKFIDEMFPFFKRTKFDSMLDAAFESSVPNQVYIFKGGEYALVDYIQRKLIAIRPIVDGFNCLKNTIFESDIGAAFASHNPQEAYLFKGNSYVILRFTPGETKDYIISGPKEIVPNNWPSLVNILPRYNAGVDFEYTGPQPDTDPNFSLRVCSF